LRMAGLSFGRWRLRGNRIDLWGLEDPSIPAPQGFIGCGEPEPGAQVCPVPSTHILPRAVDLRFSVLTLSTSARNKLVMVSLATENRRTLEVEEVPIRPTKSARWCCRPRCTSQKQRGLQVRNRVQITAEAAVLSARARNLFFRAAAPLSGLCSPGPDVITLRLTFAALHRSSAGCKSEIESKLLPRRRLVYTLLANIDPCLRSDPFHLRQEQARHGLSCHRKPAHARS
jgi:hypothetical protein